MTATAEQEPQADEPCILDAMETCTAKCMFYFGACPARKERQARADQRRQQGQKGAQGDGSR